VSTAWIVPDSTNAGLLYRSARIEAAGRLGVLAWHEPADGFRVAGLNRRETDFLYREIFDGDAYFRSGVRLPPGAVVVDVGANLGMFTLRAAMQSPGARILAVEPAAELAAAARINAELHGVNATVVQAALGNTEGEADFTFYRHNSVMSGRFADPVQDVAVLKGYWLTGDGAVRDEQLDRMAADRMSGEVRRVRVTTLAAVVAAHDIDRIDLLKIDVEKAEAEVLEGVGEQLWERIDRIVLEVHDIDGRLDAVIGQLTARGYTVGHHQDARLVLTPCHTVVAVRPEMIDAGTAGHEAVRAGGPTLRELEGELRELLTPGGAPVEPPIQFAVVADLCQVAAPSAAPSRLPSATRRTAVLRQIWSDLFGAGSARPEADFFDMGGDSLTAIRLLDRVEQELGAGALTPELIFTASTFGALAAALETGVTARS
jgi:FkbM family methyltransferase